MRRLLGVQVLSALCALLIQMDCALRESEWMSTQPAQVAG